jgi:hypothetical protein
MIEKQRITDKMFEKLPGISDGNWGDKIIRWEKIKPFIDVINSGTITSIPRDEKCTIYIDSNSGVPINRFRSLYPNMKVVRDKSDAKYIVQSGYAVLPCPEEIYKVVPKTNPKAKPEWVKYVDEDEEDLLNTMEVYTVSKMTKVDKQEDTQINNMHSIYDHIQGGGKLIISEKFRFFTENETITDDIAERVLEMLNSPEKGMVMMGLNILMTYDIFINRVIIGTMLEYCKGNIWSTIGKKNKEHQFLFKQIDYIWSEECDELADILGFGSGIDMDFWARILSFHNSPLLEKIFNKWMQERVLCNNDENPSCPALALKKFRLVVE